MERRERRVRFIHDAGNDVDDARRQSRPRDAAPSARPLSQLRPSDVMSLQRAIGNRRTADLVGRDQSRAAAAGGPWLHRKMGFEAEVRRPIYDSTGDKLAGDSPLLDHPYFTVVSDSRTGKDPATGDAMKYSNIEIVLKPFDQLQGNRATALKALHERLAAVKAMLDLIYSQGPNPAWTLTDVLQSATTPPTSGGAAPLPGLGLPPTVDTSAYSIDPTRVDHDEDGKLYVHYSLGIPPERLSEALQMVAQHSRSTSTQPIKTTQSGGQVVNEIDQEENFAKEHAEAAPRVADRIAQTYAKALQPHQRLEFIGQIMLVFTHMAAFANKVAAEHGQPKNYILALSRANLRSVFDTLSPATQTALSANADDIYEELGTGLDAGALAADLAAGRLPDAQILPNFTDDDTRNVRTTLPTIKLRDYALSGLGRHAVMIEQQWVFGGMNQVPPDPTVMGGNTTQGRGVVLELRSFGQDRVDFTTLTQTLQHLLEWSRDLILGPGV